MNKQGKVWGETELLEGNSSIEIHRIRFTQGSKCSLHCHRTKFNAFYVLKGSLEVHVKKNDYDLTDRTQLGIGEMMVVPPGEYHYFEALEDGEALEVYWSEFNPNDIVRATVGSA